MSRRLLLLAVLPFLVPGCGDPKPKGKPVVAVTNSVLADFVTQVAGPHAEVRVLVKPFDDPHRLTVTPDLTRAVAESWAVFYNGFGLEPWLDGLVKSAAGVHPLYLATKGVPPVASENGVDLDPHAWLDPTNAITYAENARDMLIHLDPAHESEFRENADRMIDQIRGVDAYIRTELEGIGQVRRYVLTPHDSLRHFGLRYGFTTRGLAPEPVQATPADVDAAIEWLSVKRIPSVFTEAGRDEEVMRTISFKTGRRVVGPLWTDTLDAPGKPAGTYVGAMKENIGMLGTGLK